MLTQPSSCARRAHGHSSPFKGEAGRGMGRGGRLAHPHPVPPLEGEGAMGIGVMHGFQLAGKVRNLESDVTI